VDHEIARLYEALKLVVGFIYPNEIELSWNLLIVIYPYITGLVAGAFILASLVKVFRVKEVQPTYRLSLLTALSFLIVAPLPLVVHLGRMERGFETLSPGPSRRRATRDSSIRCCRFSPKTRLRRQSPLTKRLSTA
jgi:Ni/Fe-hydrogenase subunit HybB-like protein